MDRHLALAMLGLEGDATPEDIERAYWEKCSELEDRIRIAPTEALKKVYQDALEKLDEARAPALGLVDDDEAPPAEEIQPDEMEASVSPTADELPEEPLVRDEFPDEGAGVVPEGEEEREVEQVIEAAAEDQGQKPGAVPEESAQGGREAPLPEPTRTVEAALSAAETVVGFLEGQVLLERYDVRYRIGLGQAGAVYAAYDKTTEKNLAIKVLLPELLADAGVRQRFEAEVKVASYLSHPNIASVLEMVSDGTHEFLIMELLKGLTLRETLRERHRGAGSFTVSEVRKVAGALCQALQYAHRYMVHGRITPDNIFLCGDGAVKLTDFAVASLIRGRPAPADENALHYCAPEQREAGNVDHAGDQYSVAAVLYEMLTGNPPALPAIPVRTLRPDVPVAMGESIDRALQADPDARYPDMESFGRAFGPVRARPSMPMIWPVAAAGLLVVGLLAYSIYNRHAQEEESALPAGVVRTRTPRIMAGEARRVATARALIDADRVATVRARADATREARRVRESAARVAKARADAAERESAAKAAAREKAEMHARARATRVAVAVNRAKEESREEGRQQVATRQAAEARRTETARSAATVAQKATATAVARVTAAARAEEGRKATATALVLERRTATAEAHAVATRIAAEQARRVGTARAQAVRRQATIRARPNYIPSLDATVSSLRFFEKKQGEVIPRAERKYEKRFKKSKTRAVYWELDLKHPPQGRRKYFTIHSVCKRPDGSVFGQGDLKTYVEANWGKSTHVYGWGFSEPGDWEDGTYEVDLFVGGKKIASGAFKIYSGFF